MFSFPKTFMAKGMIIVACLISTLVTSFHIVPKHGLSTTTKSFLYTSDKQPMESDDERRELEFINLEPLPEKDIRMKRLARDTKNRAKFAEFGDELWELRGELVTLGKRLVNAITKGDKNEEYYVREQLRNAEARDPEFTYEMEMLETELASIEGRIEDLTDHKIKALAARSCLPQFNLEGLWVGKYGDHGYEMINITYVGDTLLAFKVTGDKNVPKGEISFQADLSPVQKNRARGVGSTMLHPSLDQANSARLQPIRLTEKASKKWGTQQLQRYRGKGQVAEAGFRNNRWMDGQLIIIGKEYFSFAWVPIEQQIFFGRPSPELALKMLRDGGMETLRDRKGLWDKQNPPSIDDDVNVLKAYASSCLDKTHETLEEAFPAGDAQFSCIWHDETTEECYFE